MKKMLLTVSVTTVDGVCTASGCVLDATTTQEFDYEMSSTALCYGQEFDDCQNYVPPGGGE